MYFDFDDFIVLLSQIIPVVCWLFTAVFLGWFVFGYLIPYFKNSKKNGFNLPRIHLYIHKVKDEE